MRLLSPVLITLFFALVLSGCNDNEPTRHSTAPWMVDADYSSLSLTSIKKDKVAEAFHFETISGTIQPSGNAEIRINLASIKTGVDIRDDRMKKSLFEVILHPSAIIKTKLDLKDFTALNPGHRLKKEISFTLALHGVEKEFEAELFVTRLSDKRFTVATVQPVMISAEDFGMTEGLKTLMELAKLKAITPVVPVSFNLMFTRK